MASSSLADWLASGWSLGDAEPVANPERIDLYLLRPPVGGLKALVATVKRLGLVIPMGAFREILTATPYRLMHDVSYLPAARLAAELNRDDPCLGATEVDRPGRAIALWPVD